MFHNSQTYPQLKRLEENHPKILEELEKVNSGIRMRTWPEADKFEGSWKVFGLYHGGRKMESACKLCPVTTEVIEGLGRVVMAGFSKMAPGTVIKPHFDDVKEKVRIHLGLKVPSGACGFMIGNAYLKRWEEGKAFTFDPRLIHSAWNKTSEERVVLLVDIENFT
jgi:ornithine lipid ester-linked acyl 2-hydroxylase